MRVLVAMLVVTAGLCGCREDSPCDGVPVRIDGGAVVDICADIATTELERRQGLTGRVDLADDAGMLLHFPLEGEVCIVNTGVVFPIDAIFASENGTIVAIERNIPAQDSAARCVDAVRNVLEVNAGVAGPFGVGDTLRISGEL